MTDLAVRRLHVDLKSPIARHWAGDAFLSAWLNALSMSFPAGEQFFIDALRDGARRLSEADQQAWQPELRGFIGQEATHRHLHAQFNQHLTALGYDNRWEPRLIARIQRLQGRDARHAVAATAAIEHFTAMLAHWLFSRPELLAQAEPRLQLFWHWHAAEEAEHRCTALGIYRALRGDERWRRRWMSITTIYFVTDMLHQTTINLARDGLLWRWSTWRSGWQLLAGRQGFLRRSLAAWRDYYRDGFHPADHPAPNAAQWLQEHQQDFDVVQRHPQPA